MSLVFMVYAARGVLRCHKVDLKVVYIFYLEVNTSSRNV